MDFFTQQDNKKTSSHIILAGFILALLCTAVLIQLSAAILAFPVSREFEIAVVTKPTMAFIGIVWTVCLAGAFFRFLDVRGGGATLARRFGAIPLADRMKRQEKQLTDIVSEVAIASGCSVPEIFILERESSVNAFVVGGFGGDEVLVISRGALDLTDRDELKAIVAHEFGHIAQGDVALNMRLLVALNGLNAIDDMGRILMVKHDGKLVAQPGAIVGFVLRIVGFSSFFVGQVMKAAFSRHREYLADACAVQYTRNPHALASVLSLINEHDSNALASVKQSQSISHLCFHVGSTESLGFDFADIKKRLMRVYATHPPIQKRIDTIDPHFAVKRRSKVRSAVPRAARHYTSALGGTALPVSTEFTPVSTQLSDKLSLALAEPAACLTALHAIFVSDNEDKQSAYYDAIGFAYNNFFAHQVQEMRENLSNELHTQQLQIIENATSVLRESVQLENRQKLLKSLEKMLAVEGEFTLMNYATLQLIRRKLDAEFPVLDKLAGLQTGLAEARHSKSFDTMGEEFALLLSLIIEAAGTEHEKYDERFNLALSCYTKETHTRRSASEPNIVNELEAAFQTLYVQPRAIREAFVQHCAEISQADGHIAKNEQALLNLFAASLKCDPIATAAPIAA